MPIFILLRWSPFARQSQWRTEGVWRPGQQGLSAPPPPNNVRNPYLHKNTRQCVCNTKFTCNVHEPTSLAISCVLMPILAPPPAAPLGTPLVKTGQTFVRCGVVRVNDHVYSSVHLTRSSQPIQFEHICCYGDRSQPGRTGVELHPHIRRSSINCVLLSLPFVFDLTQNSLV
jgi:hypothetical protein